MKNFKNLISLSMILILSFSLVACKSNDAVEQEETNSNEIINLEGTSLRVVATSENYKDLFNKFTDETGIEIEFLSMSSGELLSRTKAEGGKPMADFWFGGGLDAFMKAKSDGLLESYISKETSDIPDQFKDPEGYWVAKGLTVVGFIVNNEVLEEKGLEAPQKWTDLTKPEYKDEIMMSNPAISGTNYAVVNGLLQSMGDNGWTFFNDLNKNIPYYGKRGKDPQLKATEGEVAIGITYIDNSIFKLQEERNMTIIYPEDGIPWIPEGMAIFKNAENIEGAKIFMDWIFKKETQSELSKIDGKGRGMMVKPGIEGLDLSLPTDKLLKLDVTSFGKDRDEILTKWAEVVGEK